MSGGQSVFIIRDATMEDAAAAIAVIRASISELCTADHLGNPAVLQLWLRNKTPENFRSWLRQPGNSVLLAIKDDYIVAVGAVNGGGEITLNYVSPLVRFQGVSRLLLAAMETRAAEHGHDVCTLMSSVTARRFYLSAGYVETGPPAEMFSTSSYPMAKRISGA